MNETEQMYENAGIDRIGNKKCTPAEFSDCQNYCFISENNKCDKFSFDYPPFTAEKQIALIKLLKDSRDFYICGKNYSSNDRNGDTIEYNNETFSEGLAGLINNLWQDLTEEEKQQVKGILK